MAKKDAEVTFEIHKIYGYLSHNKIFAKISWNGGEARDEIRKCWRDKNDILKLGKGIDLSIDEIETLKDLLKKKPTPVDFDAVFASSVGIMDKRNAGFKTEDGFTVLRKRKSGGLL